MHVCVISYITFIFISDDSNELKIKAPRHKEKVQAEELSTLHNSEVKVFKDGRITVKNLPHYELKNFEADDKPTIKRNLVNIKSTLRRKRNLVNNKPIIKRLKI